MSSRLHVYTVHINPAETHPYEKAEFVEEGFNWWAFFFTGLYALYKRLWWPALSIIAFNVINASLYYKGWIQEGSFMAISLGFQTLLGFLANDWIRDRLKRRGWIIADLTSGENALRAELRFYDRFTATHELKSV